MSVYIQMPYEIKIKSPSIFGRDKIDKIIELICQETKIDIKKVKSKNREAMPVYARFLIYYFLYNHIRMNTVEIGKIFSRDHSTIVHGLQKLDFLQIKNRHVIKDIEQLNRKILTLLK